MKKIIAIMLCLAMLVSVVVLSASALGSDSLGASVADSLRPFGVTPTFVDGNVSTAPVMDGVVNENEYTSVRVFEALKDNGADIPYEVNFGGGSAPVEGASVTEYVAQDEDNIYVAFVYTENVVTVDWRYNLSQTAIFDGFAIDNIGGIKINIPENTNYVKDSYNAEQYGDVKVSGGKGINADADYSFKTLKYGDNPLTTKIEADEYDAVAQRNFEGTAFKNVTAEFRLSKEAVMKATKEDEEEIKSIGYYCVAERPESSGLENDIILQTYLPDDPLLDYGYVTASDFLAENYSDAAADDYATKWRMVRYICFYADTYEEGQEAETMPGFTWPVQETDPATDAPTTDAPETDEPETDAPATDATTVAATTAAPEKGCGNSIALSALAIVPVLGLGVAVVSKKKED